MECYEGATMIKTFRGLMVDGAQDTIVLHTNDGSTGYRIVKFQLMPTAPGAGSFENVVKIYKIPQSSVDGVIDMSDNTLLAAGYAQENDATQYSYSEVIIFDKEIFNQDIFVTHKDVASGVAVNYYIELEQFKIDLSESTVATLKDIRNLEYPPAGG